VPAPEGVSQPSNTPPRHRESWIAYPIISQCTFRPTPPSSGVPSSIRLQCRDFNFVCFNFANDTQARTAFEFIKSRTCKLYTIDKLFAFHHKAPPQEKACNGWNLYDAKAEFRRQGISEKSVDRGWRISNINQDYSFSPTYPAVLAVPSKISDNTLKYAGQFRSRARIPALTYYHHITNCTITRSSQPLVGIQNKRSIQDERLVAACFQPSTAFPSTQPDPGTVPSPAASSTNLSIEPKIETDNSDLAQMDDDLVSASELNVDDSAALKVYGARRDNLIVDARPLVNSYAMRVAGKGSENMDYYKSAKRMFLYIENIHVMRKSLKAVVAALSNGDISPIPPNREELAKTGWIEHIRKILEGSLKIATQVGVQAAHVLIHCSDGWDRTGQLSALSQIMLDPYYRTIDGFIVLVEKDWLSFGHMFQQRSGPLNHENWFSIKGDAMAGTKVEPGESDGRSDVLDTAVSTATRFFKKTLRQEAEESDQETVPAEGSSAPQALIAVEENHATKPDEVSPVFHQFLDATYQILRQHPTRFEFNERFLRRLLYHLYSSQYGTFLYNNERQRLNAKVSERTSSVWDYFLSRRKEFTNPDYDPTVNDNVRGKERLLFPDPKDVRWWHQVFNRTDEEMNASCKLWRIARLMSILTRHQSERSRSSCGTNCTVSKRGNFIPRNAESTPWRQ
jgi:myotubularin-related protein 6/7/8